MRLTANPRLRLTQWASQNDPVLRPRKPSDRFQMLSILLLVLILHRVNDGHRWHTVGWVYLLLSPSSMTRRSSEEDIHSFDRDSFGLWYPDENDNTDVS